MPIITISRGSYSRGKEIAEILASKLNYECLSRDILVEASHEFNIPEIKLTQALHDAPSVLDRFTHGRQRYISYIQSAILNHVAKDNIIYHGLAGHFFLQDIPHVLKVRIIANMENRIIEEMKRETCTEDEALYKLQKDDDERRRWSMQLYGKDTWDSRLYDMVLHIDTLTVNDVVDLLETTIKKKQFQPTKESIELLKNKALLASIHSQLAQTAPGALAKFVDKDVVILCNLDGNLRRDAKAREDLAKNLKSTFKLEDVIFQDPLKSEDEYVNTFYNLDLY